MSETTPSLRATRDTAERLGQLALKSTLNAGDKQACLHAAEALTVLTELQARIEASDAFLSDEARRLEMALASVHRRSPRRLPRVNTAELIDHILRLRAELDQALPSEPRSVPFGAPSQ